MKIRLNESSKDWHEKLYGKVSQIVVNNRKSNYSGDLLSTLSRDTLLDRNELKKLYIKLDKDSQDKNTIKVIEDNLHTEKKLEVGKDYFYDYEFPDHFERSDLPFFIDELINDDDF